MPKSRFGRSGLASTAILIGCCLVPIQVQAAIPSKKIQNIKNSTVVVEFKEERSRPNGTVTYGPTKSGSGLVVNGDDKVVTIVTALQVVKPGKASSNNTVKASYSVVFGDGTREERKVPATLTAANEDLGLAVLTVSELRNPPRGFTVLDLAKAKGRSTKARQAFSFGIPHRSRNVTLIVGSNIGAIKGQALTGWDDDQTKVLPLQVEGTSDLGLVGGPLVDENGALIGVTIASQGTRIDQYVPLSMVSRLLEPRFVDWSLTLKSIPKPLVAAKEASPESTQVEFQCRLNDPLSRVQKVWLKAVPKSALKDDPKPDSEGTWGPLPTEARSIELKLDGPAVSGTFEAIDERQLERTFWVQLSYREAGQRPVDTEPIAYRFESTLVIPVSKPASSLAQVQNEDIPGGFVTTSASPRPNRPTAPPRRDMVKVNVSPDDQPKGGFSQIQEAAKSRASLAPEKTGRSLGKNAQTYGDLKVTDLDVPGGQVLPCSLWSPDGKVLFLAEKTGLVRRIKVDGFIEEIRLDTQSPCAWLSLSAEGLVLTLEGTQEVWLLDPETLQVKGSVAVPSIERAVASPASSVAVAVGGRSHDAQISLIDLKKQTLVRQYGPRDFEGVNVGFKNLAMTPDGKFLFSEGMEQLQRFRVHPDAIEYQESSERIAQNGRSIVISPDGYYVALPSGGGNYNSKPYSTHIYKITDLSKPMITVQSGAYPQTLGFDMKAGLIYAQNFEYPLIVFLPSGLKQKEYKLGPAAGRSTNQFLAHPEGRKLFLLTDRRFSFVELPDAGN